MNKNKMIIIVLGFMLILVGFWGTHKAKDNYISRSSMNGIMSSKNWNNNSIMNTNFVVEKDANMIELEELKKKVEAYINRYEEKLIISDIFIFEDSEYYFSIVEEDTGRGAMELLVNQYTGDIFPEIGPNMMWNIKYSMHNGNMMFGRGMMSFNNEKVDMSYIESNKINSDEAYDYGVQYLEKYIDSSKLAKEFHEFYGYYTFHVEENGDVVGMLSVDSMSGEVWYHQWHGVLTNVISAHDDSL